MIHSFDAKGEPYPSPEPAKKRHFHFELNGGRVTGFHSDAAPWGGQTPESDINGDAERAPERADVTCGQ